MAVEIAAKGKKATVTFTTPLKEGASQSILTGEWDNWEVWVMKKNKDGSFSMKVSIDLGKSYQFGYSIDGRWNPDTDLPLVASPFGTSNSVLDLTKVVPVQEDEPKVAVAEKKPATVTATKPTTTKKATSAAGTGGGAKKTSTAKK